MPDCYRFPRGIPRSIDYRDAVVALEIVKRESPSGVGEQWVLQARKVGFNNAPPCVIFALSLSRQIFEYELMQHGFTVERGSGAEKILQRLAREGRAERAYRRS
jgi:hypothetical protein